ncbi:MAG TPA: TlpA disulfide reductase family protein [Pyrinomonadaceae bacterium]|jgi:thiol-disulfide isomerase/thioredoxin|nr:TlpA disulfide reductase family protein [Pyrinomonadaceae bacterium]
MRKTLFALSLACAAFAAAAAQSGRRPVAPPAPQPAPTPAPEHYSPAATPTYEKLPEALMNRDLRSLEKGSFRLADFGGKVLVVNLWASWCVPCRGEIPDFEEVRRDYSGRGVEFVGLTTEDPHTDSARVKQFLRDVKFGFRLGWADRETAVALMKERRVIPQTLVITPDGHVVLHMRGYGRERGVSMLRNAIDLALEASTADAR